VPPERLPGGKMSWRSQRYSGSELLSRSVAAR
jgi:hypothetical protein